MEYLFYVPFALSLATPPSGLEHKVNGSMGLALFHSHNTHLAPGPCSEGELGR